MENYTPRTLDGVLKDFKARREGILKALTTDVEAFCEECDPEKENLCLYGNSDGTWKVTIPAEEIPPELPEPALGINFARDGMPRKDWLSLVAVHSDSWLYAVAFYYGSRFDRVARERLFNMMNELPTIFDIVTGRSSIRESSAANNSSAKSKSSGKVKSESQTKSSRPPPPKDEDEDSLDEEEEDEEHGDTLCGNCGGNYAANEFWIGCDVCEKWFHGKCVKMTPARAEHIKNYKCPSCNNKRARP